MENNKFLQITGILMIIGGVISIIAAIIAVAAVAVVAALGGNSLLLPLSAVLALVGGVVELLAGIKGAKDPVLGAKCMNWGIACVAISVCSTLLNTVGGGDFKATSLILPKNPICSGVGLFGSI